MNLSFFHSKGLILKWFIYDDYGYLWRVYPPLCCWTRASLFTVNASFHSKAPGWIPHSSSSVLPGVYVNDNHKTPPRSILHYSHLDQNHLYRIYCCKYDRTKSVWVREKNHGLDVTCSVFVNARERLFSPNQHPPHVSFHTPMLEYSLSAETGNFQGNERAPGLSG